VFLWRIGDYSGAEHFEREVARIVRYESSPDSDELAAALSSLGVTLAALGKFEEAEDLYIEALGIRRSNLPPGSPALMKTVNNYCNTLIALDRLEEATSYCNEALDVRRAQKEENPYSYAVSLIVTSGLEKKAGNFSTAESYLREAADIARLDEAYWGPRSPRYAQAIYQLGLLLDQTGNFIEAEALIEESIDIIQSLNGELSPDLYIRKSSLAKVRAALGSGHEALALATHSFTNLEFLFDDPNHPDVLDARRNLEQIRSNL
jgi:tetratricopeptide (TPR) repeat protein